MPRSRKARDLGHPAGNITQEGTNVYTYDAAGRPVTVLDVTGPQYTATYDAFSRLVETHGPSGTTQMLYAPDGFKFAYMRGQSVQKYMAPLGAGATAVYTAATPASVAYWMHADWLGSSRLASNADRTVRGDQAYAPFGQSYQISGNSLADFTGHTQDILPGRYDFLFRQYAPEQGRWLVPDPAGLAAVDITNPQTWNRYAYLANNPLNGIDLFGLMWTVTCNTTITVGADGTIHATEDCYQSWTPDPSEKCGIDGCEDSPGGSGGHYGGGNGGANAPTVTAARIPWYKNPCITGALGKGALHVGIDAIGLIPEGGVVASAFSLWHGVAAVSQGTKILQGAKLATGIVATAAASTDTAGTSGVSSGLGVLGIATTLGRAAPVVGQIISGASVVVDIYSAGKEIANCQ